MALAVLTTGAAADKKNDAGKKHVHSISVQVFNGKHLVC